MNQFVVIASDIHSEDSVFELLSRKASEPDCVGFLYAGDLDTGNPMIDHLIRNRNFVFIPVWGNCDGPYSYVDLNLAGTGWYRSLTILGKRIFLTHGHAYTGPESLGLKTEDFDLVVSGHTHIPHLEKKGHTVFLNPGSASSPRGGSPATYAILYSTEVQIRRIDNNEVFHLFKFEQ